MAARPRRKGGTSNLRLTLDPRPNPEGRSRHRGKEGPLAPKGASRTEGPRGRCCEPSPARRLCGDNLGPHVVTCPSPELVREPHEPIQRT
jgi:hypothetical protein